MRNLVVYSSLTGNTQKVAEAVADELGAALNKVEESPCPDGFDLVAVGFWVDKGSADKKAADYLKSLKNKKVALFATLGAEPDSEHAEKSLENAAALLDASNELTGRFICQGKIDPRLIAQMAKMFPEGHPHGIDERRRARHEAAKTHPDAQDLLNARAAFAKIRRAMEEKAVKEAGQCARS